MTLNKKFVSLGGAVLLVIGLITSGFVVEDRFNNQEHHDKDMVHAREVVEMKMTQFEEQVASNLQQMQRSNDYNYYSRILEDLNLEIYKMRQWIRQHPNDMEAKDDYENLKKKRDKVKEKLDSLMRSN
jgi:hypothetical protein